MYITPSVEPLKAIYYGKKKKKKNPSLPGLHQRNPRKVMAKLNYIKQL
jgi:hypothetical protein